MLLSLIPGAAHVDSGRTGRGLLMFLLFALFLNGALIAPVLSAAPGLRLGCGLAAAGVWIAALYDAMRAAGKDREGASAGEAGAAGNDTAGRDLK
jgi:hypothetical protein